MGFSFGPFDLGYEHPEVMAGPFHAIRTRVVIRAFGAHVLAVDPPEQEGAPFQLTAMLCDSKGNEILRIDRNEWRAPIANWDVEVIGPRILVRGGPGDIILRLRVHPPKLLVVERLNMYYQGVRILCDETDGFIVQTPAGITFQAWEPTGEECDVGIDVNETGLSIGHRCKSMSLGRAMVQGRGPE